MVRARSKTRSWLSAKKPPEIQVEATLQQALVNMLNNAADSSPEGLELRVKWTGTHWTLLAHDAQRDMLRARPGLRIHHIGAHGELRDEWQHFHSAYGLSEGECVLIRPDGYIAAIFGADTITHFDAWTKKWGLFG